MTDQFLRHVSGFIVDVERLAVWLVLLVVIFVPLERLFGLHPAKFWRKQIGVDLGWYFINSLFPAALIAVPLSLLIQALHRMDPGGFYSAMGAWPFWLKLPLMLLLNDFGAYWGHRALHAYPLLWRFHSIHHSAEQLDWLVNTRAHPFDIVFMRLAGLAPIYLLGLANTVGPNIDPAVAMVAIISAIWNFFIHANIRVRLGPLEWLISSPGFHHWHHSNDEHRDQNFAFIFPLIDRIFGTAWLPKHWPTAYGIERKVPPTLAGQFMDPFDPGRRQSGDRQDKT
ncbi:MAG: sterol desaturase family protein [Methylacidiphilales bacterium]|nr:sterol desaturase family protein [Candidatus Methylacidiphilales bacterium]